MDELARSILPPTESSSNATLDNNTQEVTQQITTPTINLSPDSSTAHFGNFSFKRSVKFGDEDSDRNIPLTFISQRVPSVTKRNSIPQTLRPLVERRLSSFSKNHTRVKFLSISPREELTLNPVSGENDMVDMVVLKNESSKNVVFKVKITSPEKFRVRPSTGNIAPGGTEYIRVYLQNEFRNSVPREKLLLMAVETNEENNDFGSVWKNSNEESRMEHRLKCRLFVDKEGTPSTAERMNSMMIQSKHDPYEEIAAMINTLELKASNRQKTTILFIAFIIVLQLLSLIWQYHHFASTLNGRKNSCSKCSYSSSNQFEESDL